MDIGVADESLNGIPYEESSESEEEEETEETEGECRETFHFIWNSALSTSRALLVPFVFLLFKPLS